MGMALRVYTEKRRPILRRDKLTRTSHAHRDMHGARKKVEHNIVHNAVRGCDSSIHDAENASHFLLQMPVKREAMQVHEGVSSNFSKRMLFHAEVHKFLQLLQSNGSK